MPAIALVDDLGAELRAAYRRAWERIVAEQEKIAADPIRWVRAKRLAEVRATIEELMDELENKTRVWSRSNLPRIYRAGAQAGAAEAGGEFSAWTLIHQTAVQNLAQSFFLTMLQATQHVEQSTKDLISAVAKDEALQAAIEGRTATQAGVEMRRLLEAKGIHAVRYADGSRHGLKEYAHMAQRTVAASAYNAGTINAAAAEGVKFFQIFDGPGCGLSFHDDPTEANGLIIDRNQSFQFIIAHPNCRRAFSPRRDITNKKDAKKAEKGELGKVTPKQLVAQRAQDAERRAKQARAAARRAGRRPVRKTRTAVKREATRKKREPARKARIEQKATDIQKRIELQESPWRKRLPDKNMARGEWIETGENQMSFGSSTYTAKRTVATRRGGLDFIAEVDEFKRLSDIQDFMDDEVEKVIAAMRTIPKEWRKALSQFEFALGESPTEATYRARGVVGQVAASGGGGRITAWRWGGMVELNRGTVWHEFGHNFDNLISGGGKTIGTAKGAPQWQSSAGAWNEAIISDAKRLGREEWQQGNTGGFTEHEISLNAIPFDDLRATLTGVTAYGSTNNWEDFAESTRLYFTDRTNGSLATMAVKKPDGFWTSTEATFRDLWPARADQLDKLYGFPSTGSSELGEIMGF